MNNSFNYHCFMNDIHGKVKSVLDAEYFHGRNCFLNNAFLFLDNAVRILRMNCQHSGMTFFVTLLKQGRHCML